jgi:hypothetical protein
MTTDSTIYPFNGVKARTGEYVLPPMGADDVLALVKNGRVDRVFIEQLTQRDAARALEHYGVGEGVDANDLAQAGWGVIFAFEDQERLPALREALEPLLSQRKAQAGALYRESIYLPNETPVKFTSRHEVGPGGPAVPDKLPYYLLIVGDPQKIPYQFQYSLDVVYAVGRIHFEGKDETETLAMYRSYACSVVAAETGPRRCARKAVFFGVRNDGDRATELSSTLLVPALATELAAALPDWQVQPIIGDDAHKARLGDLLGGKDTPDVLFTAGHGCVFDADDPDLITQQGALICSDWKRSVPHSLSEHMWFSARDIPASGSLAGLIAFHFACYGGGTPLYDNVVQKDGKPVQLAPRPFVAALPQKELAHGGALAVVGHVDQAWSYSFVWAGAGPQTAVFSSAFKALMAGKTIGNAMEYFNDRFGALVAGWQSLKAMLEDIAYRTAVDSAELAGLWAASNDARNFVIIGDPAVRLSLP